ncbi:DUF1553 domain-containing protein [Fimbriiglobus ruber]|nr:DUF1553 domain-containing protein [Fimbriiglobus ruber]
MTRFRFVLLALIFLPLPRATADEIDFRRDVLPILSNHCWACHGPDEKARKSKLRLDTRDAALAPRKDGTRPIAPGKPEASEVVARVTSADADLVMPPAEFKKPLTDRQKDTLRKWIVGGAAYAEHWAFVPPKRGDVPTSRFKGQNAIDAFVFARLEKEGLAPSPEADRAVWLRRVTLDLTGVPPTPDELDAFRKDVSADAHARVVDRLLASPRYAERMAMHWLDAARYADTNGYNNDELRTMWPWRDWVIGAFARGLPYDQFLTEQLAGDLLPNATVAQKVATGFNRNHVLTTEGGIIEEEYRAEYVADRVHTASTVFMAVSVQCARCHDHKFDPVSQKDFYRLAAFFNTIPDGVVGYGKGIRMAEPVLKVPSPEQQAELAKLDHRRGELEKALRQRANVVDAEVAKWEQSLKPEDLAKAEPLGLVAHFPLDDKAGDQVVNAVEPGWPGKLQGKASRVPGKLGGAFQFDGTAFVAAKDAGVFEADAAFTLAAWIRPTSAEPSTVLSRMDDAAAHRGYDVILEGGKLASHFVHHWPDSGFKVITKDPLKLNEWHHVAVVYDGSRKASGVSVFVDGKPRPVDVTNNNQLAGSLKTDKPFHIGRRGASAPFKGAIDEVRIYATKLTAEDVARIAAGQSLAGLKDLLATPTEKRTEAQRAAVRQYFLDRVDPETRKLKAELAVLPGKVAEVEKTIPATMVMQDLDKRKTFVLVRGQYDKKGEEVQPGVPERLAAFTPPTPRNRLDLAKWLTHPDHPLTARVAVNRWWEMLFGLGLVETSEDFGVQGSQPSHPELLDWLATELVRTGWDQRALLKLMVLSATYRQSSRVTPALLERDPRNRLLTRGPRYRLPAEMVRDQALFVSGLLKEKIGGPSVKPYQPAGLWEDVSVERRDSYTIDSGDGLYRRSLYTFWKRTCPPPGMSTFDAPDRETCVVRRARTNTPLQALALLNDPTYVEAARKLAERTLAAGTNDEVRLAFAWKVVLCREPTPDESKVIQSIRQAALARFKKESAAAEKLLKVGNAPRDPKADPAELAAWAVAMSALLNLDEAISKP